MDNEQGPDKIGLEHLAEILGKCQPGDLVLWPAGEWREADSIMADVDRHLAGRGWEFLRLRRHRAAICRLGMPAAWLEVVVPTVESIRGRRPHWLVETGRSFGQETDLELARLAYKARA